MTEIKTHADMLDFAAEVVKELGPDWCPRKETEWGEIQVPPDGAREL